MNKKGIPHIKRQKRRAELLSLTRRNPFGDGQGINFTTLSLFGYIDLYHIIKQSNQIGCVKESILQSIKILQILYFSLIYEKATCHPHDANILNFSIS